MRPSRAGFTLVEMLMAIGILAILCALICSTLNESMRSIQTASGQMAASAQSCALSNALESDLGRARFNSRSRRHLGLSLNEDEKSVCLAVSLPVTRIRDLDHFGSVAHVLYRWDKATKTVTRSEFHSVRVPKLVQSTGGDIRGANLDSNAVRAELLAPSYRAAAPNDWIESPLVAAQAARSAAAPLLFFVADFEVTPFLDPGLQTASLRNSWDKPSLPAAVRVRAKLAQNLTGAASPEEKGLRCFDLWIPLTQAESAND